MSVRVGAQTLYELAVENGDRRLLLMYCSNKCRRTILDVARKHADKLKALTGKTDIYFADRADDGATMGEWRIRWTGRTQREAQSSKLPWIGDL